LASPADVVTVLTGRVGSPAYGMNGTVADIGDSASHLWHQRGRFSRPAESASFGAPESSSAEV